MTAQGQEEDLKVGLVLSGGGAKGLAHIAVLEAIDEAGVRIDYIGGTSMGALIGGLYAAGYSGRELDSLARHIDIERLIQDDLPRQAKTFYEKAESEKYALTLPFDDFKISFPSSISKGYNFYNLLQRLTAHVSHIDDFSDLPTPFFCIAADMETGRVVKLDSGNLAQAMTASGALPTLFNPVERGGQLLIDGGVADNYPVEEVRAMGADIIIGVDVQDSLRTREELHSAIEILTQINNFRTIYAMRDKRPKTDIYITPKLKEYTAVSFGKSEEIIEAGKAEAQLYKTTLEELAHRQNRDGRPAVEKAVSDSLHIDGVRISGNEQYTRAYIMGKLQLKLPEATTYQKFSEGLNNLAATGNFTRINHHLEKSGTGRSRLHLQLSESKTRNLLRMAVHYDDLYKSAALMNVTRKWLLGKNDVASLDLILGDYLRYNFDYYIDKGYYWSIGLRSRYNHFDQNVRLRNIVPEILEPVPGVSRIRMEYHDVTNQFYVQTLFQQIFQIRIGAEHKYLNFRSGTLSRAEGEEGETVFENTHYYSAFGIMTLDSYDDKYFPKKGLYFSGKFNFYPYAYGFNREDFDPFSIARAKLGYAFSPFDRISGTLTTEAGVKIGGHSVKSLDFFVGGYGYRPINNFVHLYGYDALDIAPSDTYLAATLRFNYEIFRKNHLILAGNIANVEDGLFRTAAWLNQITHSGVALGYGANTFIGPVELLYSFSPERDEGQWYVSVGFWF